MTINIRKVAQLARIELTDAEADLLAPQLANIFNYVDSLQQINTDGVVPTAHPHDAAMPLRADLAVNSDRRDFLQAVAPQVESGLYVVPKVIE